MVDAASIFILVGTFLGIGFLADLVFAKTGVPDLLVMMFLGMLVGPVFRLVERGPLLEISPLFAALAIAIILFDGGLNLNMKQALSESPRAMFLALLDVAVSILNIAAFSILYLGWSLAEGALLGSILGGTSSAVVIPLIEKIGAGRRVTAILSLESVFTDSLVVVVSIYLIQLLQQPTAIFQLGTFTREISGAFLIGAIIGMLAGVLWTRFLKEMSGRSHIDILTLAMVLTVYGIAESAGGNGAISTLLFGLVLSNARWFASVFGMKNVVEASLIMKRFQHQVSFLIRTFFFAFLGIIFLVNDPVLITAGLLISGLIIGGRYLSVFVGTIRDPVLQLDKSIMTVLAGRGLATAVLANLAAARGIGVAPALQDISIIVILVTVIVATMGIHFPKLTAKFAKRY